MWIRKFLVAVPALLAVCGLAAADDVKVRLLDNKTVEGVLSSISDGEVVVKTADATVPIALSQVLEVFFREPAADDPTIKYFKVVLTDDTTLRCKDVVFQPNQVELTLLSGVTLKVPITSMVSFCREANNQALTKKFEDFAQKRENRDRIVVRRVDNLSTLEGTIGEVKGKTIVFRTQNNMEVDINLEKLHGIIFFRNPVAQPANPICKVIDIEGNTLSAVKVAFDAGKLTITTTFGNELVLPEEVLSRLDFNQGKLTFLSNLVPTKTVVKSGIGLAHSFCQDTNLDGDAIFLDKKSYTKGLSMHSYTDLEYNLNGKFKELKGVLGIDTRTGADSEPKVTIYCDDRVVFSEVITAKKVMPINMDIKGIRTLRIVVSSKNLLDLHDHVTFAEGQLTQ
jgi:ribosome maturation factor RimP